MKYSEQLPAGCPPESAETIVNERIVYRLVQKDPPTIEDFKSQRANNPFAEFIGVSEYQAIGLSVHTTKDASKKTTKLRVCVKLLAILRIVGSRVPIIVKSITDDAGAQCRNFVGSRFTPMHPTAL